MTEDETGKRVLAIGAPVSHLEADAGAVGRVYGFDLAAIDAADGQQVHLYAPSDPAWSIVGDQQSAKVYVYMCVCVCVCVCV